MGGAALGPALSCQPRGELLLPPCGHQVASHLTGSWQQVQLDVRVGQAVEVHRLQALQDDREASTFKAEPHLLLRPLLDTKF